MKLMSLTFEIFTLAVNTLVPMHQTISQRALDYIHSKPIVLHCSKPILCSTELNTNGNTIILKSTSASFDVPKTLFLFK